MELKKKRYLLVMTAMITLRTFLIYKRGFTMYHYLLMEQLLILQTL